MKCTHIILLSACAALLLAGCGKDNYEQPGSRLAGRVVYAGEPLQLAHGSIQLQLSQDGFGKPEPAIPVYVAADGTFTAALFDGQYLLSVPDGAGPWQGGVIPKLIDVAGTTQVDLEVVPYYLVRNPQILVGGSTLKATCDVQRVASGGNMQFLCVFVGKTRMVDGRGEHHILQTNFLSAREGENVLTQNIGSLLSANEELWARIGLKIDGLSELIYGPTVKIK